MASRLRPRRRSAAIRTGRRDTRSIQTPAKRLTPNQDTAPATGSRDVWNAVASSVSTATSGIATSEKDEPSMETSCPSRR
jgi:hypothetical protein